MECSFVVAGDLHYTEKSPSGRSEQYGSQILDKLAFIIKYANKHGSYILLVGDLFHLKSNVTNAELVRLIRVLKKSLMPVYSIAGSHDLGGGGLSNLDNRPLGVLQEAGVLSVIPDKIYFENGSICVSGSSVCPDYELTNPYSVTKGKERVRIHLTHGMLMDYKDPRFECTDVHEVETEANFVFNGHYHHDLGVKKVNGTVYVRRGSVGRDSVDLKKHQPRFTFLKLHDPAPPKLVSVKIPCEKDVWVEEALSENYNDDGLKEFAEMLASDSKDVSLLRPEIAVKKSFKKLGIKSKRVRSKTMQYAEIT